MGAETLTGRIVNAIDLIDGILDAGSIRDYTSRDQLIFMREQLTSMASHLRHHTAPAAGVHALMSRMVVDSCRSIARSGGSWWILRMTTWRCCRAPGGTRDGQDTQAAFVMHPVGVAGG